MNLPKGYSRCRGEFGFVWESSPRACDVREQCLRHMQMLFDTENWHPQIPHCIDQGAFIPLEAFKDEDE